MWRICDAYWSSRVQESIIRSLEMLSSISSWIKPWWSRNRMKFFFFSQVTLTWFINYPKRFLFDNAVFYDWAAFPSMARLTFITVANFQNIYKKGGKFQISVTVSVFFFPCEPNSLWSWWRSFSTCLVCCLYDIFLTLDSAMLSVMKLTKIGHSNFSSCT